MSPGQRRGEGRSGSEGRSDGSGQRPALGARTHPRLPPPCPAPESRSRAALPLDVRPSARSFRGEAVLPEPGAGKGRRCPSLAARPLAGPTARGQRGPRRPAPRFPTRCPQPCVSAGPAPALGVPGRRTTSHTHARTRSRRAVFPGRDPASGRGRQRAPAARSRGARNAGSRPVSKPCAPSQPLTARGLGPRALPLGPLGSRRLRGARRAGGQGVRVGAAGSGPRGGWAPRRGKFGRGKLPPRPPGREEGAHGGWARAPRLPLRPEARPPRRPPRQLRGPGGLPPAGQPPLGGDPAAPPAAPGALTSGSGLGLPGPVASGRCAWGGSPGAGGRASPEPGGARRSRRESGRESGSRGGECARV